MNETIQLLLAMIVPGCLVGMAFDAVRVAMKRRRERRQECRRPQGAPEVGHA